jgi:hypothetical protein
MRWHVVANLTFRCYTMVNVRFWISNSQPPPFRGNPKICRESFVKICTGFQIHAPNLIGGARYYRVSVRYEPSTPSASAPPLPAFDAEPFTPSVPLSPVVATRATTRGNEGACFCAPSAPCSWANIAPTVAG